MGHHTHDHHADEGDANPLSFSEKARKLLEHWIHHNAEHAQSYQQWAERFTQNDLAEVAVLLNSAAEASAGINRTLEQALHMVQAKE